VRPAALLCLDEPTNHLDLASREVLEEALAVFPGTIVFISHDRYFINRIGTEVTHVDHGRLTRYLGGYDDYVTATTAPAPVPAPARALAKPAPRAGRRTPPPPPRKQRVSAEVRDLRRRVEEVEARIQALEARLEEIGVALADPALYVDGERARAIAGERKTAEEQMAWLMREWEALSTALAGHD